MPDDVWPLVAPLAVVPFFATPFLGRVFESGRFAVWGFGISAAEHKPAAFSSLSGRSVSSRLSAVLRIGVCGRRCVRELPRSASGLRPHRTFHDNQWRA